MRLSFVSLAAASAPGVRGVVLTSSLMRGGRRIFREQGQ